MGTYTTNYNLFMPSIGEQGWGEIVNGNFSDIDATMKSLSNSIGTLETETDAMKEKLDSIEVNNGIVEGEFSGRINSTYTVTFSDIFVDFAAGGVTYTAYTGGSSIILQPLPTVTYNCPSTITLNVTDRPASSSYKSNAGGTVKLYTYDGSAWTLFSSEATEYRKTYSIELAFPTSTKGVWITMAGGNGFSIAHPLPIIV